MHADVDFSLLERWRGGDAGAGQELFARQFPGLYRFFATKCDGDTDELVQATLVACLKAKETFRAESSFRGYLFTVARHELYRYFRARQRAGQHTDIGQTSVADLATTTGTKVAATRSTACCWTRSAACHSSSRRYSSCTTGRRSTSRPSRRSSRRRPRRSAPGSTGPARPSRPS